MKLAGWSTRTNDAEGSLVVAQGTQALTLEVSFPDAMHEVAESSGHLTASGLGRALDRLRGDTRLIVTHLKPGHEHAITQELLRLGHRNLGIASDGERYRF